MKSVAFADGEELTQVRRQRNWISVSGFRGDRIFYRQALLACAGDRWHQIAFEYPSRRAAQALEATQNAGCDIPTAGGPMSECGGPLAQEHLYKYRSGWRQPTSGNPRTSYAQRSHTVDEGGRCTL
jgi:hypothetical protein